MEKSFIFSFLFLFIISPTGALEMNNRPLLQETFIIKSYEKETGKERWRSVIEGQAVNYQGKNYVYFQEKGVRSNAAEYWNSSSYSIVKDSKLAPLSVKVVVSNRAGEMIDSVNKYYDWDSNKIICNNNGKVMQFNIKTNMADKQNLGLALMDYPFETKKEVAFHMLTNEPAEYEIFVKFRGKEKVMIGDDETECYKLEMVFNLGLLNIFGVFIPKFYLWYETKAPHNFVRYEGLESGMGTPYVVVSRINKL
jgi:hypothetical protein